MRTAYFQNEQAKLLIVLISKYFNLLAEYGAILITAVGLGASIRGDFVITITVISAFSIILSFSFEQYGAVIGREENSSLDTKLFFHHIMWVSVFIASLSLLFTHYFIEFTIFTSLLIALSIITTVYCKQSIVEFQLDNKIIVYSVSLIFGRLIYVLSLLAVINFSDNLNHVISCYLIANIFQALCIYSYSSLPKKFLPFSRKNIDNFISILRQYSLIHLITVMTSAYAFIDLLVIYKNIGSKELATYNLAIQFNAAVAVCGQAYNTFILSNDKSANLQKIILKTYSINFFILIISLLFIILIFTPHFSILVDYIFGDEYSNLIPTMKITILMLPFYLVSMFYAPLWIFSKHYKLLLIVSIMNLCIFTLLAFNLIHYGIKGIIIAKLACGLLGLVINMSFYRYLKKGYIYES